MKLFKLVCNLAAIYLNGCVMLVPRFHYEDSGHGHHRSGGHHR